ncbi:MAG: hypothetical protein HY319_10365 [Armatimonadetes bacterium]|nr:hypothetical protein [Armatimonadota bacterium]
MISEPFLLFAGVLVCSAGGAFLGWKRCGFKAAAAAAVALAWFPSALASAASDSVLVLYAVPYGLMAAMGAWLDREHPARGAVRGILATGGCTLLALEVVSSCELLQSRIGTVVAAGVCVVAALLLLIRLGGRTYAEIREEVGPGADIFTVAAALGLALQLEFSALLWGFILAAKIDLCKWIGVAQALSSTALLSVLWWGGCACLGWMLAQGLAPRRIRAGRGSYALWLGAGAGLVCATAQYLLQSVV